MISYYVIITLTLLETRHQLVQSSLIIIQLRHVRSGVSLECIFFHYCIWYTDKARKKWKMAVGPSAEWMFNPLDVY